jgi:hypothetical protein
VLETGAKERQDWSEVKLLMPIRSITALSLLLVGAYSASADSLHNVYVSVNESPADLIIETPNGSGADLGAILAYNSNLALNGSPVGSSVNIFPAAGTTYSVPTALGLTSATAQASSSAPYYGGSWTGQVFSASGLAKANLATGSVGVSASGNAPCYSAGCSYSTAGTAEAQIFDTLTFKVAGANRSTVTDIGVQFAINGSINPGAPTAPGIIAPYSAINGDLTLGGTGTIQYNFNSDPGSPANGRILADGGWVSSTIVSQSPSSFIFDGVYALDGATATVPVLLSLQCVIQAGSCGYADTAAISFTLPSNVSFTSDSGVFLTHATTAAPEPAFWPVFAGALLVITVVAAKRRRASKGCLSVVE